MAGWFLDIFVEYLFRVFIRSVNLFRSRNWPVTRGTVLSADCPRASYGCTVATVYYDYIVGGKKYGDTFGKPFISHGSGQEYAAKFVKGMEFKLRFKQAKPSVSVHYR
jgi:hypothetical protein